MVEASYESLVDLRERARVEVAKVVIGQDRAVELLLVAALARGHVLLEGPPGSAKTLLGRAVAHMLGAKFKRIQFTPDTAPAELIGVNTIRAGEHLFLPGVVFTNVLLADEINRTPPRTQAALLEAMQERQVTVEGKPHRLPDPFLVIATQNPYEKEDVHVLPESQLDRFLFKVELNYADSESEYQMLDLPHRGVAPDMLWEVRALHGRARPQDPGARGRRARRELTGHHPPGRRGEGERAPQRPRRGNRRRRPRYRAFRAPPSSHPQRRYHAGRGAPDGARAGAGADAVARPRVGEESPGAAPPQRATPEPVASQ